MMLVAQFYPIKLVRRLRKMAVIAPPLLIGISIAAAQTAACSSAVREALNTLDQTCDQLGINMACYGQDKVYATVRDQSADVSFNEPSDTAALHHLQSIQTAEIDMASQQWGIAVMKVQASLENTLPGQGIMFIMLGDVTVDNGVGVDEAEKNYTAMQAFHFTSGMGHLQCVDTPSALVVQGPNDLTVNINANGVDIDISSTLMLTQTDAQRMRLTTLSGEVKATNPGGDVIYLPEGFSVDFEVDAAGQMVGVFDFPKPISAQDAALSDVLSETNPSILHYPIPGHGENPRLWPVITGSHSGGGDGGGGSSVTSPGRPRHHDHDKKDSGKDSGRGKGKNKKGRDDDD